MPLAESPPPLRPVLRLFRAPRPGAAVRERLMDCAQPWFEIDGARYRAAEPRARSKARQRLEREALETLAASGLQPLVAGDADLWAPRDSQGWFDWMLRQQDRLQMQGWQIELDADFGFRLHEPAPGWTARLEPGEDPDWFNLALDIEVDGQTQPLLPLLRAFLKREGGWTAQRLAALRDDEPLVLRDLADERWIKLPAGRLKPILATLGELYEARPRLQHGTLRLPRAAAGAVLDLAGEAGLSLQGEAPLRAWAQPLADPASLPAVAPPTSLRASLRPYQQQGLNWLQFLRAQQLGGVLADDMGLGKTLQTLAHLLVEQAAGRLDRPALVIAPTSLMFNWRAEARRFAPSLRVQVLQGPGRRLYFDRLHQYDLLLSTYALLPRDVEALSAQTYSHLILDEAQAIKNPRAQAAQALARLRARHRLCLSGTPLENHLGELWALMDFLMPGLLGDASTFRRRYRLPIERDGDEMARRQLARRVRPYLLRRTKEAVAPELPPRTEIVHSVPLEGDQRLLYEAVRLSVDQRLRGEIESRGLAGSQILVLDALLKLRQVCCDPRLLPIDSARGARTSVKLELLMSLLPPLIQQGRRVLLFSQFTTMLELIRQRLDAAGLGYLQLTGDTRDREGTVRRFQAGEQPLFLISLKAGGVGLNLTAADTVIHYDPWWNPAVEQQATDRAHRIGQDKPVFVYKLLTEGTVEARIQALQARKKALAEGVLGAEAAAPRFSADEVEQLLAAAE